MFVMMGATFAMFIVIMMMFVVVVMMFMIVMFVLCQIAVYTRSRIPRRFAAINFSASCKIRQHTAKQSRYKRRHWAQNSERESQQRIRRQDGIYSRRRSRNQKAHASTLASTFLANFNRSRNHAAAANRKQNTKDCRPKHRCKIPASKKPSNKNGAISEKSVINSQIKSVTKFIFKSSSYAKCEQAPY